MKENFRTQSSKVTHPLQSSWIADSILITNRLSQVVRKGACSQRKKTFEPHPTLTQRRESKIPINSKVYSMTPWDFNFSAHPTQSSALWGPGTVSSQDFPVSLIWSRVRLLSGMEWLTESGRALDSHQRVIFRWPFEDMRCFIELPKFPLWHYFCTAEKQLLKSIQDLQLP